MDSFATAVSLALQHGVPLRLLVDKFSRMRFEPSGYTGNPELPRATSVMDYLFRWLGAKFLRPEGEPEGAEGAKPAEAPAPVVVVPSPVEAAPSPVVVIDQSAAKPAAPSMYGFLVRTDAPTCPECGSIMVPNGSCHKCTNCGTTSGCS
jgi:ribonucleoside-diphosphate reductase alpha chain